MSDTMHEQRRRLDARLERLRPWVGRRPREGWIRTIRTALGMSGAELGARIGVSQSRVSQIERGELDGTLSLAGLERVAHGLDCDLVYALVPRSGLERAVRVQALAKAAQAASVGARPSADQEPPTGRAKPATPETSALVERIERHPAAAGKRLDQVPQLGGDQQARADSDRDPVQVLAEALIDRRGLWSDGF